MRIWKNAGAVTAIILFLAAGCDTLNQLNIKKPTADLKGLKFGEVTLQSATLLFDVEIKNPYPAALPLLNMDYGVSTNSKQFASGSADIATTIPAESSKVVSLPVKVGYLDVFNAFKDVRPGSLVPYKAQVGLSVDTPALGKLRLPIDKTGEMVVPSIPKLTDIEKVILDKAGQMKAE
jgi:LEA14-like dessication related protein